jgi:predicted transposase/invertase (TIGR01784 family)
MAKYIHFDWAMKRMLRDKANFDVLEGFLTSLLERKITIDHLLESEGNQESADDKFNRVDLMARDDSGDTYAIEIQNTRETDYFHRMLYGVSKFITEHIKKSEKYKTVRKIYSINIVYFEIGQGKDYAYHGYTEFHGLNDSDDILYLSKRQMEQFSTGKSTPRLKPGDIMPEYYILRVEDFDSKAVTPLDEWISFLKTGDIPETAKAPGLTEARNKLIEDSMTEEEYKAYQRHLKNKEYQHEVIQSNREEGREEGRVEGREEGRAEGREEGRAEGIEIGIEIGIEKGIEKGRAETIRLLHSNGESIERIASLFDLSSEKILEIINQRSAVNH